MGKSAPSAPAAPDPYETAEAQAAANKETAVARSTLNMVDQYTPSGSLTYEQIGAGADGTPRFSATQTLSPEQQQIFDLQNQASIGFGETANSQLAQVTDSLGTPIDFSTLGPAPVAGEEGRQAAYDALIQRNQPQAAQQLTAMQTTLANQGIGIGSEAYNTEMDRYSRAQNDFGLAAQGQAMNQMSQQYGIDTNARQNALNEMVTQRQIPLNELTAMLSGSQVTPSSFVNAPQSQIGQTPLADSVYGSYNGAMNQYQIDQKANSSMWDTIGGLAGTATKAAFMFSDRRLKKNVIKIGHILNGLAVYTYDYIWGGPRQTGLMAHEVYEVNPQAVAIQDGFLMVNYEEAVKCPSN